MKPLLFMLIFAATCEAQTSRIALYGSAGLDLESTWLGMRPGVRESNPLLGQSKVRQAGVMLGLTALTDWAGRKYPKVRWIAVGVHVVGIGWNLKSSVHQQALYGIR